MNFLAIDTTNSKLTVVLSNGEKDFHSSVDVGKSGHSRILMQVVDDLLKTAELDVCDIDAVGVVVGPGSFTGIRIGVSAMTAIAFATGAKRVSVTSFELLAYHRESVRVAVDAGHGNLYVANCKDGKVLSSGFLETPEKTDEYVFESVCDEWEALLGVMKRKIDDGEFVEVLAPYYLRKSQAEREKDEI